ncbi:MAG: membrane protein insertase YidC [Oleiphilaceae bacterium]|uniref:membrane protein insertase YidC n=1 Tax=Oleiphilus sp. HI0125 TaxID=1822266 RepID=UPI0007C40739|nr:membrane protein insertase YidC [Oleiphilus sp. HI0125]KZZ57589.1 membrane protein insertase YidC [Oleiphilus sp. HI0125]MCH2158126.1 membrane protein insertase YidC [Oleiphilaceae bacterium]
MDIKRTIIFVGLAIVSYMLVLEWNKDYGTAQTKAKVEQQSVVNDVSFSNETSSEAEFAVPGEQTQLSESTSSSVASQYISVVTDVLDLKINTEGGNLESALLLNYDEGFDTNTPLPLLQNDNQRFYIIESGLFGKNGFDSSKNGGKPIYQSAQSSYVLADNEEQLQVDLNFTSDDGVALTKRYTFARDDYRINVEYLIDNQSQNTFEANFSGKIVRDRTVDPSQQNSLGMQSYLGMVLSSAEEPYEKIDFEDMLESPVNQQIQGGWIAFIQHYFISAWIPDSEVVQTYQTRVKNGRYLMGYISPATVVAPGEQASVGGQLYLGPKIIDRLEATAKNLDLTVDYGWLFFVAYPLFLLLDFLHGLVMNWGVAIILVTVVVKALFFKLSAASYRSMANMRRVAPKLQQLKEQYGDDRQKMSQAMMDLYRKESINPLGGCLPILVQMPVFIALYWVLMESVQLRHAPFFLWIEDLSVQDPFFVLPILMGISMFIQMQLNPTPPDPMQAKIMKIMPVMMTVFFLWFPSGLVLYWLVNNILSIAQQWYITRQIENGAKA